MNELGSRRLFFKYAVPQMVGLLFNSIYLIVDGVFIGNRLGRIGMAAAAISVPVIEILIAISMALASGAGIMISDRLGRERLGEALRIFKASILLSALVGSAVVLLGNHFCHGIARLLGATPGIHDQAVGYLRYIVLFSPFLLFSFLLGGLARNDGRPGLAMTALTLGSLSNVVLDYLFLYPMDMGIEGAALATAIGPVVSVIVLLPHFLLKKGRLYLEKATIRWKDWHDILRLGSPSFVMEFSIGIITFIYNVAIVKNGYGETGLAAYLVIGYMMLIFLTLFLGMAEGLQPVFSYLQSVGNHGKNDELLSFARCFFLAIGISCHVGIVLFGRDFISIFSPEEIAMIDLAEKASPVYFAGFFLAGFNILEISFRQSTGVTRSAMTISLLRSVVAPPVLIGLLPLALGRESIWACHSLAEAGTACYIFKTTRRNER
ncbi:hypothetical protein L2W58_10875 [Dethiosulfovibrio sp. F2B]|uniref:MATE family efflux transporter n=1 Tax=Dethiosulfovibrio faecalis TaxID=2720018 RepID=UPI001EFF0505|nr:MATE family efflux transporter [Dethiosulfovibrio faecalis]MCF4152300.1 hypothetical protein [Dethiosulfovibrio faecalis]